MSDRDERKRRGMAIAGAKLRQQVIRSGGADPGQGACVDRVKAAREAVAKKTTD